MWSRLRNPNAVMVEALTPLRGRQPFVRGSTGRTVINQVACRMQDNYTARPTESTRLDARQAEDVRPAESTRLDARYRDVRPAESTRLDGMSEEIPISTPAQKTIRNNAMNFFSPIVFQTEIKEEQNEGEDQMKHLEYGEKMGNNLVLVSPPPHSSVSPESDSRLTPDSRSSFSTECGSASLTPYNLTDLTTRLGGTLMDISHQADLDVSAQLGRGGDESDNRVADTMDELEKLMMKLSHVFTTFREPKTSSWTNEEHGAVVRLLGEVGDNISISSAALAAAKESVIC